MYSVDGVLVIRAPKRIMQGHGLSSEFFSVPSSVHWYWSQQDTENPVNQSDKKRGKTSLSQSMILVSLQSDWIIKWREFFKPIVKHSWSKTNYFSTLKWKTLHGAKESYSEILNADWIKRMLRFASTCFNQNKMGDKNKISEPYHHVHD